MAAIREAGMAGGEPSAAADGAAAAPAAGPSPVAAAEARLQELMKKQATMNSVTEHLQAGDETAALGCLIKITGVPQPLGPGKIASQEIARCEIWRGFSKSLLHHDWNIDGNKTNVCLNPMFVLPCVRIELGTG